MATDQLELESCPPSTSSKYEWAADYLRQCIDDGTFPVGSKLPSVRELGRLLKLSTPTAFRALQELSRDGLVVSHAGPRGTEVVRQQISQATKPTTLACLLRPHRPRNAEDNFGVDMLQGVRNEISNHRYRFVYHCLDEADYDERMMELVEEEWVCGVLIDQHTPSPTIRRLTLSGLPCVLMNSQVNLPGLSCVTPDYERIVFENVRLLWEKGYRRLAFNALPTGGLPHDDSSFGPSLAIYRAFQAASQARNLSADQLLVIEEPPGPLPEVPETYNLPRRKPANWQPLGVICDTDRRAAWMMRAITQTDLQIGRDIGIIGCYDLEAGRNAPHPLSTWRVDPLTVGSAAAAQLIVEIEHSSSASAVVKLPATFIDRGSF